MTVYNVKNSKGETIATKRISDTKDIPEHLKGIKLERAG